VVNTVNDTVGSELETVSKRNTTFSGQHFTYNVNGNDPGVKVDSETPETDVGAQTLRERLNTESSRPQQSRNGASGEDTSSRVEVRRHMVRENSLNDLLAGLLVVLRNSLERSVSRSKDSKVRLGAIESFDKVWVLIDHLCKDGGIVAHRNQLIYREI